MPYGQTQTPYPQARAQRLWVIARLSVPCAETLKFKLHLHSFLQLYPLAQVSTEVLGAKEEIDR
ncbi:hypothetical protein METHPM2_1370003 [Pseudomonas sp. PM2]